MDNFGIISQYGFEFQKLAFVYYALGLSPVGHIVYEGKDDVEISQSSRMIGFHVSNSFVQVKSGEVTKVILEKIFLNWLLDIENAQEFICIIENDLLIDFKDEKFSENLIKKICKSEEKQKALVGRVYQKYISTNRKADLKSALVTLINEAKFIKYSVDQLRDACLQLFINEYESDVTSSIIHNERFDDIYHKIHNEIDKHLLNKEPYILSHKDLHQIIFSVSEKISDVHYEKNFDQFKKKSVDKVDEILALDSDSVKQLKLVFPNNKEEIINGLTKQIFYEDLRNHYYSIAKNTEIESLEYLAHSNYEDVLQEFRILGEKRTAFKTYKLTTEKNLTSPLLPHNSSAFKFYNIGCYIHLTDVGVADELKIKWGSEDEE